MPLDANEQGSDPSADPATLDAGTDQKVEATGAQPSGAQDVTEQDSLLSVVRDVVDDRKEDPAKAASSAEGQKDGQIEDDQPPKPDDENFSDVPFHKHPRFQQLLRKAKENEADAARHRNVQTFLDSSGLPAEEAAEGLTIMAQAKVDPAGAWQRIRPWVEKLLHAAGEVLPEDLASEVQAGRMTREHALEMSRLRAQTQTHESRRTFEQQLTERRQVSEKQQKLYDTAVDWERDRFEKDPNFEAKVEPLQKELLLLQHREGKPDTPEGVKDQLNRAYKAVTLPSATPQPAAKRREIKPVTGGSVAGGTRPEPKSILDIVKSVGVQDAA